MMGMGGDTEPEQRTVEDLPVNITNGKVYPVNNATILHNSYEKLRREPENLQLEEKTVELAKRLARPQGPLPLAWQILIDKGVLLDGMNIGEAGRILGHPTKYWHRGGDMDMMGGTPQPKSKKELYRVMWYYNYFGTHVETGLVADVNDINHTYSNWQVTRH